MTFWTDVTQLTQTLLALLPEYGYVALVGAALLGAAGLPFPVSLLLLASGALAAGGVLGFPEAVGAALAGAVAGDCVGYFIGRYAGRPLLEGAGPRVGLTSERLARADADFARSGSGAIWLSRWLITGLGPVVNLLAGINRFRFATFLAVDAFGEACWALAYTGAGWLFADRWEDVADLLSSFGGFALAAAAALLLAVLAWRQLRQRNLEPQNEGSRGGEARLVIEAAEGDD